MRARSSSNGFGRSRYASGLSAEAESAAEPKSQPGTTAPGCAGEALNPAWQAMAVGGQAKLSVSAPGDPGEVEADRVADAVVGGGAVPQIRQSAVRVSRKCAACAGDGPPCPNCEQEERVQRKADGGAAGEVGGDFGSGLGGGASLGAQDRSFYEARMGHDFGDVRIHTGSEASSSARSIGARAYTLGSDIAFADGEYDTGSTRGKHLLGHELTHVVQQRGSTRSVQRAPGAHDEEIARSRESPGRVTSTVVPLRISIYNFGIDAATLKEEHLEALEQISNLYSGGFIKNIRVAGHTDTYGDDLINGPLSNDRAMAVEEFLYANGATVSKVDSRGSGSPVADNGTEGGRSRNRRVDITFDYVPPKPPDKKEDDPEDTEDPPVEDDDGDDWDWPDLPDLPDFPDFPSLPVLPIPCFGPVGAALCFCIANPLICALPFTIPLWPDFDDDDDDPEEPEEPEEPDDLQCGDPELPLTHVEFDPSSGDRGNRVLARPLTRCEGNTHGSRPDIPHLFPDLWYDCIVPVDGSYRWVHGHLLHGATSGRALWRNLHGPGDDVRNIIFMDRSINGQMSSLVEGPALDRVWDNDEVLWYDVEINHFTGPYPRPYFAESVDMEFGTHDPLTGVDSPAIVSEHITSNSGYLPPECDDPHGTDDDTDDDPDDTPPPQPQLPEPETPPLDPEPHVAEGPVDPSEGFDSTIQICHRVLESRTFDVRDGRLIVDLDARWLDDAGNPVEEGSCPGTEFNVTLRRIDLWAARDVENVPLPIGRPMTVEWSDLDPGRYSLTIWTDDHDPNCCITGTIRVRTPGSDWWPPDGQFA